MDPTLVNLSDHLVVYTGAINVGIILQGNTALMIDFDPEAINAASRLGIDKLDRIMFTHHHRDQACGAWRAAEGGTKIGVAKTERALFDDVSSFWNNPEHRWHLYNFHPHHLTLAESLPVDEVHGDGDIIEWGAARISVISTPGHTDGSLSYIVDVDGERTVFCGDTIYDEGKVWEVYSLQKGTATTDYHGFVGSRDELTNSLKRIRECRTSRLVPSHGVIMENPDRAIEKLVNRLETCYNRYAASSSLRHYFPDLFTGYLDGPDVMPIREGKPVPDFLRHFGTTWLLLSQDGVAFAMDCGATSVIQDVRKLFDEGTINRVEGLWVTHYHDDHVDAVPDFKREFGCPVIADEHVAEVIEDPLKWVLACISPVKVSVDRYTSNGESWRWHEFNITAYHLPGQTLYHGGLFVEGRGLRMFFSGDSFTMAGIDDYCCQNRNFLGSGLGFDLCLELMEKLGPDLIFNCHVSKAFDFTHKELAFLRLNLKEREREFGQLIAWDSPNYGLDQYWVRCHPYEQHLIAGEAASLKVVVTNHSASPRSVMCRAVLPRKWGHGKTDSGQATIAPAREGRIPLSFRIPGDTSPGRYIVPIDVKYGKCYLPQFTEAVIEVSH